MREVARTSLLDLLEGHVIPGRFELDEQSVIEQPAAQPVRSGSQLQDVHGLARYRNELSSGRVHRAHVTVGYEATPESLKPVELDLGEIEQVFRRDKRICLLPYDDMGIGSHHLEHALRTEHRERHCADITGQHHVHDQLAFVLVVGVGRGAGLGAATGDGVATEAGAGAVWLPVDEPPEDRVAEGDDAAAAADLVADDAAARWVALEDCDDDLDAGALVDVEGEVVEGPARGSPAVPAL